MAKRKEVEAMKSIPRPARKEACTDLVQTLAYDVDDAIANYEDSVESQWRLEDETYKAEITDMILRAETVKLGDEVPELNRAADPKMPVSEAETHDAKGEDKEEKMQEIGHEEKIREDPKTAEKDGEEKDQGGEKKTGMGEGPGIEKAAEEKEQDEKTGTQEEPKTLEKVSEEKEVKEKKTEKAAEEKEQKDDKNTDMTEEQVSEEKPEDTKRPEKKDPEKKDPAKKAEEGKDEKTITVELEDDEDVVVVAEKTDPLQLLEDMRKKGLGLEEAINQLRKERNLPQDARAPNRGKDSAV